jgi:hypothetical protein
MQSRLSRREAAVWRLVETGADTSVDILFLAVRPAQHLDQHTLRRRQQIVGDVVSRLNKKLRKDKLIVKPGTPRHTYKLISLI